jgi:hypothetical protein
MKVYYFNDELYSVKIRVISKDGDNELRDLAPQESGLFEVHVPEESVLFVKRWDNRIVLLSHIPIAVLEN